MVDTYALQPGSLYLRIQSRWFIVYIINYESVSWVVTFNPSSHGSSLRRFWRIAWNIQLCNRRVAPLGRSKQILKWLIKIQYFTLWWNISTIYWNISDFKHYIIRCIYTSLTARFVEFWPQEKLTGIYVYIQIPTVISPRSR